MNLKDRKLQEAKTKLYHNYRGRKHSLLSLSCLPYKYILLCYLAER